MIGRWKMPKVSICIPIYQGMGNSWQLLKRNLDSIIKQTFKNYEIVISDDSTDEYLSNLVLNYVSQYPIFCHYSQNRGEKGMAQNINYAIDKANGELVKILFQDDFFYSQDSLDDIIRHFTYQTTWLVTGCTHFMDGLYFNPHEPYFSESENTIGSPSVLTFRRTADIKFDPQFRWVLDLDLYKQFFRKYGSPKILKKINVVIGIHEGQTTYNLSDEFKIEEHRRLKEKYEKG